MNTKADAKLTYTPTDLASPTSPSTHHSSPSITPSSDATSTDPWNNNNTEEDNAVEANHFASPEQVASTVEPALSGLQSWPDTDNQDAAFYTASESSYRGQRHSGSSGVSSRRKGRFDRSFSNSRRRQRSSRTRLRAERQARAHQRRNPTFEETQIPIISISEPQHQPFDNTTRTPNSSRTPLTIYNSQPLRRLGPSDSWPNAATQAVPDRLLAFLCHCVRNQEAEKKKISQRIAVLTAGCSRDPRQFKSDGPAWMPLVKEYRNLEADVKSLRARIHSRSIMLKATTINELAEATGGHHWRLLSIHERKKVKDIEPVLTVEWDPENPDPVADQECADIVEASVNGEEQCNKTNKKNKKKQKRNANRREAEKREKAQRRLEEEEAAAAQAVARGEPAAPSASNAGSAALSPLETSLEPEHEERAATRADMAAANGQNIPLLASNQDAIVVSSLDSASEPATVVQESTNGGAQVTDESTEVETLATASDTLVHDTTPVGIASEDSPASHRGTLPVQEQREEKDNPEACKHSPPVSSTEEQVPVERERANQALDQTADSGQSSDLVLDQVTAKFSSSNSSQPSKKDTQKHSRSTVATKRGSKGGKQRQIAAVARKSRVDARNDRREDPDTPIEATAPNSDENIQKIGGVSEDPPPLQITHSNAVQNRLNGVARGSLSNATMEREPSQPSSANSMTTEFSQASSNTSASQHADDWASSGWKTQTRRGAGREGPRPVEGADGDVIVQQRDHHSEDIASTPRPNYQFAQPNTSTPQAEDSSQARGSVPSQGVALRQHAAAGVSQSTGAVSSADVRSSTPSRGTTHNVASNQKRWSRISVPTSAAASHPLSANDWPSLSQAPKQPDTDKTSVQYVESVASKGELVPDPAPSSRNANTDDWPSLPNGSKKADVVKPRGGDEGSAAKRSKKATRQVTPKIEQRAQNCLHLSEKLPKAPGVQETIPSAVLGSGIHREGKQSDSEGRNAAESATHPLKDSSRNPGSESLSVQAKKVDAEEQSTRRTATLPSLTEISHFATSLHFQSTTANEAAPSFIAHRQDISSWDTVSRPQATQVSTSSHHVDAGGDWDTAYTRSQEGVLSKATESTNGSGHLRTVSEAAPRLPADKVAQESAASSGRREQTISSGNVAHPQILKRQVEPYPLGQYKQPQVPVQHLTQATQQPAMQQQAFVVPNAQYAGMPQPYQQSTFVPPAQAIQPQQLVALNLPPGTVMMVPTFGPNGEPMNVSYVLGILNTQLVPWGSASQIAMQPSHAQVAHIQGGHQSNSQWTHPYHVPGHHHPAKAHTNLVQYQNIPQPNSGPTGSFAPQHPIQSDTNAPTSAHQAALSDAKMGKQPFTKLKPFHLPQRDRGSATSLSPRNKSSTASNGSRNKGQSRIAIKGSRSKGKSRAVSNDEPILSTEDQDAVFSPRSNAQESSASSERHSSGDSESTKRERTAQWITQGGTSSSGRDEIGEGQRVESSPEIAPARQRSRTQSVPSDTRVEGDCASQDEKESPFNGEQVARRTQSFGDANSDQHRPTSAFASADIDCLASCIRYDPLYRDFGIENEIALQQGQEGDAGSQLSSTNADEISPDTAQGAPAGPTAKARRKPRYPPRSSGIFKRPKQFTPDKRNRPAPSIDASTRAAVILVDTQAEDYRQLFRGNRSSRPRLSQSTQEDVFGRVDLVGERVQPQ
ncbi:unnamed protein product [Sympodiomycopsis kandeliae]